MVYGLKKSILSLCVLLNVLVLENGQQLVKSCLQKELQVNVKVISIKLKDPVIYQMKHF